jgi:hypothetical protein
MTETPESAAQKKFTGLQPLTPGSQLGPFSPSLG